MWAEGVADLTPRFPLPPNERRSMAQPLRRPPSRPMARPRRGRPVLRRVLRVLAALIVLLILVLVAGGFWAYNQMRTSLPRLDGERRIAGLAAPVEIERDDLGVPTIHAANRLDAARAPGFLHAQDRFFQMDLLAREAAGELAESIGPAAVQPRRGGGEWGEISGPGAVKRAGRPGVHRFRALAEGSVAAPPPQDRALLAAYADGANAGLSSLGGKPFEYLVLRVDPAPWRPEDSI